MSSLTIPYKYKPRPYQIPLLKAMDSGYKRAVVVWHRRAGKDKTLINLTIKKMLERVGSYYYFFPTYNQGRKILWEGMDRGGMAFLNHIPQSLIVKKNDSEMKIELKNGSILRVIGTDNIDSIVGSNPVGCVFSEYALQDPLAWDYIRPILAENGGWAIFNFTPRGENHGYDIYNLALGSSDNWFCQMLTVDDTGVISKEVLEQERQEIIAKDGNDALFSQEYYCNFKVPIAGAYYAKQIIDANNDGRICDLPVDRTKPVDTWWDIGVGDSTAIWFTQDIGNYVHVIDFYDFNNVGLEHYIKVLQDKKYIYGNHYAPHDIEVKEFGTGKTRLETARSLGINFKVVRKLPIDDGINAVRNSFNLYKFDEKRCRKGLNALKGYHKEYDEINKVYRNKPKHDWCSHPADAFRYFAVGHRHKQYEVGQAKVIQVISTRKPRYMGR